VQEGARAFQASARPRVDRHLPAGATLTVLVSSFPIAESSTPADIAALTEWLESSGFPVFYADVDLGSRGRWQRVLAGAYTDAEIARRDADRLRSAVPKSEARLVSAGFAAGVTGTEP
jgi:SPOR domain